MDDPTVHGSIGVVDTFLIIDDNAHFREQARELLEADGYVVVGEAADGSSGLRAVRSLRPDLILLDIGLPDMDGFEVVRCLGDEGLPTRIVLTSSREAAAYGRRLAICPVLGFIAKDELSGSSIRALTDPG